MLLEDDGEIDLGHVVGEGAVTEDGGVFTRGSKLLVPFDHYVQGVTVCDLNAPLIRDESAQECRRRSHPRAK